MVQKLNQENATITLGYWGIRGLAQPIRFLLAYVQEPFSEVRLGLLQDGTVLNENKEGDDWQSVKSELTMPFPNLPYLIDTSAPETIQLTQSNAILRYLARRFDCYGDSEKERVEIDVLQEQAYDFRNAIVDAAYTLGADYPAVYEEFCSNSLPKYLDSFELYLSSRDTHQFFVGARRSLVDFVLYELLWQMTLMVPGSISTSSRPSLHNFLAQFAADPIIADYMASDRYLESPINSPWASFA